MSLANNIFYARCNRERDVPVSTLTFTPPPGLVAVPLSNYCEGTFTVTFVSPVAELIDPYDVTIKYVRIGSVCILQFPLMNFVKALDPVFSNDELVSLTSVPTSLIPTYTPAVTVAASDPDNQGDDASCFGRIFVGTDGIIHIQKKGPVDASPQEDGWIADGTNYPFFVITIESHSLIYCL